MRKNKGKQNEDSPVLEFILGFAVIIVIGSIVFGIIGLIVTVADKIRDAYPPAEVLEKRALWIDWITRRDEQCKISGKTFGIVIGGGKHTYQGNMTSWVCNGVVYSLDDRITEYGNKCLKSAAMCNGIKIDEIPKLN